MNLWKKLFLPFFSKRKVLVYSESYWNLICFFVYVIQTLKLPFCWNLLKCPWCTVGTSLRNIIVVQTHRLVFIVAPSNSIEVDIFIFFVTGKIQETVPHSLYIPTPQLCLLFFFFRNPISIIKHLRNKVTFQSILFFISRNQ